MLAISVLRECIWLSAPNPTTQTDSPAVNSLGVSFADFTSDPNTYALQVRGESMVEDHICDGDYVLVERAATARDGEIVVALVEGTETTLKRFYKEAGDRVRLQPANAAMKPIYVPASSVAIQGKVLAVLRRY